MLLLIIFKLNILLKECGRNPWDLKNMIKLIFLASIDKIESSIQISKQAKSNIFYRSLCGGIEPSARNIREYIDIFIICYLSVNFKFYINCIIENGTFYF